MNLSKFKLKNLLSLLFLSFTFCSCESMSSFFDSASESFTGAYNVSKDFVVDSYNTSRDFIIDSYNNSKEYVKEKTTYVKDKIHDVVNSSEDFSEEAKEKIISQIKEETYTKDEVKDLIKKSLEDTYTKEEVDRMVASEVEHLLNDLDGVRIVETYKKDYSYYRIYSDSWIEQGGRESVSETTSKTIDLFKEMSTTKYSIQVLNNSSHTSKDSEGVLTAVIVSTKQIKITAGYLNPNTANFFWEVKGFIPKKG